MIAKVPANDLHHEIGGLHATIRDLEKRLEAAERNAADAREWRHLKSYRHSLFDGFLDDHTSLNGDLTESALDGENETEDFIPGSHDVTRNGVKYRFTIRDVTYDVTAEPVLG